MTTAKATAKTTPQPKEADDEKTRQDERKETLIATCVVILVAILFVWWGYTRLFSAAAVPTYEAVGEIPVGSSPTLGASDAPVTVVLFTDFECPYCGNFARDAMPRIKTEYIDTGKARIVFKNFPLERLHPDARLAAIAATCADEQRKFWEYHDLLFASQEKLARDNLLADARTLSLDEMKFTQCLDAGSLDVDDDIELGQRLGVTGTPTFFFNGQRVVGAISADDFGTWLNK